MLQTVQLETGYGRKMVVDQVSIEVNRHEIVAMIGRNGAGKSTLLKAIIGLLPAWHGQVLANGKDVTRLSPAARVRAGIAYVGQGNRVFGELSVDENLNMGGYLIDSRSQLKLRKESLYNLFPGLARRRKQLATTLSGGERQSLAFAMGLMPKPKILLLDEPSVGLSSELVRTSLDNIRNLSQESGVGILIVEQKVREVLSIADRVYLLTLGKVGFHGSPTEMSDRLHQLYLA
jgi:ABC-type branched-subunit amino acid transport system ATPase component